MSVIPWIGDKHQVVGYELLNGRGVGGENIISYKDQRVIDLASSRPLCLSSTHPVQFVYIDQHSRNSAQLARELLTIQRVCL